MATLEEKIKALTAKKNNIQQQPEQTENVASKALKKQPTQNQQGEKVSTKKVEQQVTSKAKEMLEGAKHEADAMEHGMVVGACNAVSKFLFEILIYPLELLDAWIVCSKLDKQFKTKVRKIFVIYLAVVAVMSIIGLFNSDLIPLLATAVFAAVVYKLLGV